MILPHLPRTYKNYVSCLSVFPLCLLSVIVSDALAEEFSIGDGDPAKIYSVEDGVSNTLQLEGSVTPGNWALAAGYSQNYNVKGNKVESNVSRSVTVAVPVFGGYMDGGGRSAESNKVSLENSSGITTVSGQIIGGYVSGTGIENNYSNNNSSSNTVSLKNVTVNSYVAGGYVNNVKDGVFIDVDGDVTENCIDVTGATIGQYVVGDSLLEVVR